MSEPVGPGPNTGVPSDARAAWLFTALFLLTATTGMVDATSFLGLGQVFTANMTGMCCSWASRSPPAPLLINTVFRRWAA